MTPPRPIDPPMMRTLRTHALRHADVVEGVACKGTSLESTTFGIGKKTFLFVGSVAGSCNLRVKLTESRADAATMASNEPERYSIGASGWTSVRWEPGEPLPVDVLKRWIDESYRIAGGGPKIAKLRAGANPAKR